MHTTLRTFAATALLGCVAVSTYAITADAQDMRWTRVTLPD